MKLAVLFAVTGMVLASGGITVSTWQLYAVMVAMAVSYGFGTSA